MQNPFVASGEALPAGLPFADRVAALTVFLIGAGVLLVALLLTPDTRDGVGTHKALGLPAGFTKPPASPAPPAG